MVPTAVAAVAASSLHADQHSSYDCTHSVSASMAGEAAALLCGVCSVHHLDRLLAISTVTRCSRQDGCNC